MTEKQFHPDDASDLRRQAEESVRADEAMPRQTMSTWELKRLVHELQVHQVELEMQNDELRRTQSELEASRARYVSLYDFAPVGYFTLSEKGLILEVNVTGAGLLGLARRDLFKQPLTRFIVPEDQDIYHRYRRQLGATGSRQVCELRLIRKDAPPLWTQLEAKASLDDESGESVHQTVMSDITDRKQAETILKAERDLACRLAASRNLNEIVRLCLDAAIENSGLECGGIYLVNPASGRQQIVCFTGLSSEFIESVAHVEPGSVQEHILEQGLTVEIPRAQMEEFGLLTAIHAGLSIITAIPVMFEQRPVACLNVASRTTTSVSAHARSALKSVAAQMGAAIVRAQAEESLRESEEKYRAVVEDQTEVICRLTSHGTFQFVNDVFCRFFGRKRGELLGKQWQPLVVPEDLPPVEELVRKLSPANPVVSTEFRVYAGAGAGDVRWLHTVSRGFFDGEGNLTEFQAVGRDVTERKQAEDEKLELERRLLHAQKLESLGILAGGIAHDFNNILAGIMGYADLAMLRLPTSQPALADIEVIKKAAQRAADLTRQMLAYSGKGRFIVEPVDLSQVVKDMYEILEISISKKASLKCNLASGLPAVHADASQIQQVILNLVMNASETFGEDSGIITIATDAIQCNATDCAAVGGRNDLREGSYVRLVVTDTGCGMDEQTLAKIFDPFFTTKFTGRGLGLAAVHGIVRGHKGAIRVASKPGEGTTFQVLFPASDAIATVSAGESIPAKPWRGTGTVLVVDDEEMVRNLATRMIEHAGFVALTANDGEDAVRLYREHQDAIVCVLLDLTMPKMNGEETLRELQRISPNVRVILSSGYSEEAATARFAQMGLAGFIQKPYRLDAMIAQLRGAVTAALPVKAIPRPHIGSHAAQRRR